MERDYEIPGPSSAGNAKTENVKSEPNPESTVGDPLQSTMDVEEPWARYNKDPTSLEPRFIDEDEEFTDAQLEGQDEDVVLSVTVFPFPPIHLSY